MWVGKGSEKRPLTMCIFLLDNVATGFSLHIYVRAVLQLSLSAANCAALSPSLCGGFLFVF